MSAVMGWLARSRVSKKRHPSNVLSHPTGVLIIGVTCSLLFLTFAMLSFNAATGGPVVALGFLAFGLLGVYFVLEYYVVRFELLPAGLRFRTLFRGSGLIEWSMVRRVSWSDVPKWFVIVLPNGAKIRVSALLRGLPAFADAILTNVPSEYFQVEARTLLLAAAAGELPRIW